jgi:two-component system sensor histidine kinase/response regulator
LLGENVSMLMAPETYEYVTKEIIPTVLFDGTMEFELPILRKDGALRWLSFSSFRMDSPSIGVGAIASDVTEQRQLSLDLVTAKEQAEETSLAKSDFLSRMSHEMRTPLSAIIGMTAIAKASDDMARKEYCLEKIEEASNHLLGVINDILDMSKIEAQKFELASEEFDFEKMILHVIDVSTFPIEEKNIDFVVDIDPAIPANIVTDRQRLAQVLTNLLSNATKFTPENGSIHLSLKQVASQDNFSTIEASIADTGIGISEEQQSRLFRSFEQADGGIARRFGGTGLGLAISKNIIDLMGGEIWVDSELGKGSTFSFRIHVQKGSAKKAATVDIPWQDLRVLFVDDASEVREYFSALAERVGFQYVLAKDGKEACALMEAHKDMPFHIIFVDWKMPEMNGVELTRQLKEAFGSDIVVIMISAYEWNDIREEAMAAGVDRFIPKPLFSSQIINCIVECLGAENSVISAANEPENPYDFSGKRILLAEDIEINREIVISLLKIRA